MLPLKLAYKRPCYCQPTRVCCHTLTKDWLPSALWNSTGERVNQLQGEGLSLSIVIVRSGRNITLVEFHVLFLGFQIGISELKEQKMCHVNPFAFFWVFTTLFWICPFIWNCIVLSILSLDCRFKHPMQNRTVLTNNKNKLENKCEDRSFVSY